MNEYSETFLRELPKTDLHVHLDGSIRLSTLIELAKGQGVQLPSYSEEGLRETVFKDRYENLVEYLNGFQYTCAVLQTPEALERAAYELAHDNFAEGVRYFEVRFAPQLHVHANLDIKKVISSVARGLDRARAEINQGEGIRLGTEPRFEAGIITCAMRMFTPVFSEYYRRFMAVHAFSPPQNVYAMASLELARAVVSLRNDHGLPIVGFDLAGTEAGYPAGDHEAAYAYVHRHFVNKTVHAGEAYGPESIFQAITELHADRIGHGYHLFSPERIHSPGIRDRDEYIRRLAQYIAERRVTLEVCLTSNLQTMPELTAIREHALSKMLLARLSVTLCTDNRTVSNTSVSNEIGIALKNFNIGPHQLKNIIIYGFKRSFFPGSYNDKRNYVRQVIDYYETVAKKHGY